MLRRENNWETSFLGLLLMASNEVSAPFLRYLKVCWYFAIKSLSLFSFFWLKESNIPCKYMKHRCISSRVIQWPMELVSRVVFWQFLHFNWIEVYWCCTEVFLVCLYCFSLFVYLFSDWKIDQLHVIYLIQRITRLVFPEKIRLVGIYRQWILPVGNGAVGYLWGPIAWRLKEQALDTGCQGVNPGLF